jgi:anti-anti-sigma factor
MFMQSSNMEVARSAAGYLIRVSGQGTSRESPALAAFVTQYLEAAPQASVVLDLSVCEYLDSTFLGCLLMLHRRCAAKSDARFVVAAEREARRKLLAATHLDVVLQISDSAPAAVGGFVRLHPQALDAREFGRHVMESHRALSQLPGEHAGVFREIADRLAQELEDAQRFAHRPGNVRETV